MYDQISLEEYVNLTPAQKKLVKKDKLAELLDKQLQNRNLDNDNLKKLITDTITKSIDALKREIKEEMNAEVKALKDQLEEADKERQLLKKVVSEQQNFLEGSKREKMKNKVYIAGVPDELTLPTENRLAGDKAVVLRILTFVKPDIVGDDYEIVKSFEAREGFTRHACLIEFKEFQKKKDLLKDSPNLKNLADDHVLKKVKKRADPSHTKRELKIVCRIQEATRCAQKLS